MPTLNRIITLHIAEPSTRNQHGETVPGAVSDYTVWSEIRDGGSGETLDVDGARVDSRKGFTVRWRQDIIDAQTYQLQLTDDYGRNFTITDYTEIYEDTRKRFIELLALRTTG